MERKLTPGERKGLEATHGPEKLQKHLRRTNLLIPIETLALLLCIASLCIEGYNGLIGALTGILAVQILHLVAIRRDMKQQLAPCADEREK